MRMNNFDNKTANVILKANFGFQEIFKNNIFTFGHRMVDGELEFYGFEILDGCDEYYSMILDKRTCEELAKGFLELSMCFKETLE